MSNAISDHADAVLALLRDGALADIVLDGVVPPGKKPPYVLVYMHAERPKGAPGNSIDGLSAQMDFRTICHCVGPDATGARAMASQVETALLDVVPEVPGRECGQISRESSASPVSNEETGTQVMDQVDVYRVITTPAA